MIDSELNVPAHDNPAYDTFDVKLEFHECDGTEVPACTPGDLRLRPYALVHATTSSWHHPANIWYPFWPWDGPDCTEERNGCRDIPPGTFDFDFTQLKAFVLVVNGGPCPPPWICGTGLDGGEIITWGSVEATGVPVLLQGMATGGGWFIAENTGGTGNVTPGGKATFGFVAKNKNATASGETVFRYKTDDLTLKSWVYDWVNVSATQALFEGTGLLNGVPGYRFRVRAVDGDKLGTGADRFEIRIWTGVGDGFLAPTHRAEGNLWGGQIVVNKN